MYLLIKTLPVVLVSASNLNGTRAITPFRKIIGQVDVVRGVEAACNGPYQRSITRHSLLNVAVRTYGLCRTRHLVAQIRSESRTVGMRDWLDSWRAIGCALNEALVGSGSDSQQRICQGVPVAELGIKVLG